jgi:hypothetical protein
MAENKEPHHCKPCNGIGMVEKSKHIGVICPACNGSGKFVIPVMKLESLKVDKRIKQDISDVLDCVDYDFDEAKRHEETLEAYNRIRPLISGLPRLLAALSESSRALTELDPLGEHHNAVLIDEALKGGESNAKQDSNTSGSAGVPDEESSRPSREG